ncbi:MAG: ABC transporter permease [Rhizobiales bacterium]|nr:ABC transporter permease [Hyphomicrobiales bacterium]
MARRMNLLPVTVALAGLLALWELAIALFRVPGFVLPRPLDIATAVMENPGLYASGMLLTALEAIGGFAAGAALGFGLAVLMVLFRPLERALVPIAIAISSVPSIAFIPLALVWFGLGPVSKVAMAALAVVFVVLLNTLNGLKRPDREAINLLRSFGAGRLGILWRLQLPAAMPAVVTGLRVGLARSTIAVIVAEMLGAYAGIGQIIYQATVQVDALHVWAGVAVATAGSLLLNAVLVAVDRRLVWWS